MNRPWVFPLTVLRNRLGQVPRPGWCTYLVSYRCNARCGMCDSWRLKPGSEMSPAEVARVFAKIGPLDVVRLTGGEPFLREDLSDLARAVQEASAPAVMHVTSNGSFPERTVAFAEGFPKPERLRFLISFDGLAPEHDASRGADVLFSVAEETVRRLADLRGRLGLQVSVNHTVISEASLRDHFRLAATFAPLGVDVQVVLAYSDSAMYGLKRRGTKAEDLILGTGYPLHPNLQGADVVGFVRTLLKRLPRLRDPVLRAGKRYYLRGLLDRLRGAAAPHRLPRCVALRSHLRLLPDGRVPVCQFNTETVGNLLHQEFDEVWQAPATRTSRAWVDACPGCWAECEVMPSAIYTGDLFANLF